MGEAAVMGDVEEGRKIAGDVGNGGWLGACAMSYNTYGGAGQGKEGRLLLGEIALHGTKPDPGKGRARLRHNFQSLSPGANQRSLRFWSEQSRSGWLDALGQAWRASPFRRGSS